MHISFSIAPDIAVKLYLLGFSQGHWAFAPKSLEQQKYFAQFIQNNHPLPSLGDSYEAAKEIKRNFFTKDAVELASLYPALHVVVSQANLAQVDYVKSQNLCQALEEKFDAYLDKITSFFDTNHILLPQFLSAYIMPVMGESGESLDTIVVIGDGQDSEVAFGIFLEELLHASLTLPPKATYGLESLSDHLFEESYIGAWLFQLLTFIEYDQIIRDSLVFGWHDGEREQHVRQILPQIS